MENTVGKGCDQREYAAVKHYVKNYKIFIDTCSLLSSCAEMFWQQIVPILREEGKYIIVPLRVFQEVEKYADNIELCKSKDPENAYLNNNARRAKENIINMQREGLVQVFGDKDDNFADNVFQTVFTKERMQYNLLLITQDTNLTTDIRQIAASKAVLVRNDVKVCKINRNGCLRCYDAAETTGSAKGQTVGIPKRVTAQRCEQKDKIPKSEMFERVGQVSRVQGTLNLTCEPSEGDTVFAENNGSRTPVKLTRKISSGGEGTIYDTDTPNYVAKVYRSGKLDCAKYEKVKLMLSKNIRCEGVCFPVSLLLNQNGEFVGYLMEKAKGTVLQKCLFIPKLLEKRFPDWRKIDTVQLSVTILKKLKYLHDRNIILGDINPNNILVVNPSEVYFVDTDSYQIEGFPCPVGTINFTAPEIQGKRFDSFLRTIGNEQFAVSTLLFMMMLPGKPPYSLQGGENQIDNIIKGDFAYASGERTTGKAPEGMWRYIWSHLPRFLKDDFYETFRKDGTHHAEDKRFSDADWLEKFERYAAMLKDENSKFLLNDAMSAELFPTRLKKDASLTYIQCKLCKRDVDEERTEQGYCKDCLRKGETYCCSRCGNEVIFTNYQKLILNSRKHDICKACNDRLNSVYSVCTCANPNCGKSFQITYRMKEKYATENKSLPTVCDHCRQTVFTTRRCQMCNRDFSVSWGEKEYLESKQFELPKKCKDCRNGKTSASRTPVYQSPCTSTYSAPRTYSYSSYRSYNSGFKRMCKNLFYFLRRTCRKIFAKYYV